MLGTLGMISAPLSTHSSHPRRKRSAVRRYPGQSRQPSATSRRARRPGVPSLVPPRGVGADAYGRRGPHLRRTPPLGHSRSPRRGRAPSRPAGKGVVSRRFPLVPERLPHRVGADLCIRPRTGPVKDRGRADTWVGPYGFYCSIHRPRGKRAGTEPRPYRPIGSGPMGHRPLRGFLGFPERAGLFGPAALAAGMDAVAAAQRQVEILLAAHIMQAEMGAIPADLCLLYRIALYGRPSFPSIIIVSPIFVNIGVADIIC